MTNKEVFKKFLEKIKFQDIDEILELVDNDIDIKSLYAKMELLVNSKIPVRIIRIIIDENPLFLTEELETLQKNMEILKKYLDLKDISILLEVSPDVLTMENDYLEQNIKLVKIISKSDESFKIILKDRGDILTYRPDYLSKRLAFLAQNGFKECLEDIVMQEIDIFDYEEDEIDIDELKENYLA